MSHTAKPLRGSPESVDMFVSQTKIGTLSRDYSRIGGDSLKSDAHSPAHTFLGDLMGNPATSYVPSNIVTPQVVWLPIPPALGVLGNILMALKDILTAAESDLGGDSNNSPGRIIRPQKLQVIDYNSILPTV